MNAPLQKKICVNCKRAKDKLGMNNLDINHDTKSIDCPIYKRKIIQEKNKTIY